MTERVRLAGRRPAGRGGLGLLAVGAVSITLLAACGSSTVAAGGDKKTVKIAIGGPFTGDAATTGQELYQGADLAASSINDAGGISGGPLKSAKITLVKYDDKDDPQTGVTVARQVLSDSSILAYAGSAISDVSVAQGYFGELFLFGEGQGEVFTRDGEVHDEIGQASHFDRISLRMTATKASPPSSMTVAETW